MGDFKSTQEFHDSVLQGIASLKSTIETSNDFLRRDIAEIKTGKFCPRGVENSTRLDGVEASQKEIWKKVDEIRHPVRRAIAVGAGGGISLVGIYELAQQVWKLIHGG